MPPLKKHHIYKHIYVMLTTAVIGVHNTHLSYRLTAFLYASYVNTCIYLCSRYRDTKFHLSVILLMIRKAMKENNKRFFREVNIR